MLRICSSLQDQQFLFLDHSISSSYERVMIKVRKQKLRENFWCFSFSIFLLRMNGREWRRFKSFQEREASSESEATTSHSRVGRVWPTGPEGCSGHGSHGLHTWWPRHGLWPCTPLSRTSHIFRPYSGVQTLNSNLFLDYEL